MELRLFTDPWGQRNSYKSKHQAFGTFAARLPDQPIFYPVTNEEYATQIARDWNVRHSGAGFVTRFQIHTSFRRPVYPAQTVGAAVKQSFGFRQMT